MLDWIGRYTACIMHLPQTLRLWCMQSGFTKGSVFILELTGGHALCVVTKAAHNGCATAPTAEQEWTVNDMGIGQTLPKGYSPVPEWEIPSFETEDWKER